MSEQRTSLMMATSLSCLAGFNDAVGFRVLGGYFVSFMSGNSTQFGVNLSRPAWSVSTFLPLGLVALFVSGVIAGAVLREMIPRGKQVSVLVLVTAVLGICAGLTVSGQEKLAVALIAVAMGASNNVFVKEGEVSVPVTYVTGTLVKLGQRLAGRLCGSTKPWHPNLFRWLALILGAVAGSLAYSFLNLQCLWISVGFSAGLICLELATQRDAGVNEK